MIYNLEIDSAYNDFRMWFVPLLILIFGFFFISSFIKAIRRKSRVSLYFSLANFCYLVAQILLYFAIRDIIHHETKTDFYLITIMLNNVAIILNALFLYLFYTTISMKEEEAKKKNKKIINVSITIILFHFLPQNDWLNQEEGFSLKYISFMLLTIYSIFVYLTLSVSFFQMSKRASLDDKFKDKKNAFSAISLGAFFMILSFIIQMIRVSVDIIVLQFVAFGLLITAFILFYLGFIQPSISKK